MLFVLGVLVFIHELGHFIVARLCGVRVEKFSLGFGPKLLGVKKGHTEYLISAFPLGGYVKMAGDEPDGDRSGAPWEFYAKKPWQRIAVVFAGPFMNLVLAAAVFSGIFMVGMPVMTSKIGDIKKGYPADFAGLKKGDEIVALNGKPTKRWDELTKAIYGSAGKECTFTIKRNVDINVEKTTLEVVQFRIRITPKEERLKDIFGNEHQIGIIGITPSMELIKEKMGFFGAVRHGCAYTAQMTAMTYQGIWLLITRQIPANSIGGPILIAKMAGETAKMGIVQLFNFLAVLSISLAVLNLLPIPILDGGHIMFYTFEAVRRKPMSLKAQLIAQKAGLAILVALMVFATYNDVTRFADSIKNMGKKIYGLVSPEKK
jgi:regulator of sigma E protease